MTPAVVFGFGDASAERVVGHFHDRFSPVLLAAYFDQTVFGVVGKVLHTSRSTALFDHSAEAVVAVTLVLIGQQFVMHHQPCAGLWAVEQVGGGVVGEGFALALWAVLAGDDAAGGVVVQQFAVFVFPAADQVVGGVVLEVLLRRCRHQRGLAGVAALAGAQAAAAVVFAAGGDLALGAQHFEVQAVAFEVADELAVAVELVQVAAAVVQAIEPAAVGQLRLDQVAEFVVVMVQASSGALFGKQLAQRVVGVFGTAVIGHFRQQAPDGIALQAMHYGRRLIQGHVFDSGQVIQGVIGIAPRTAVEVLLLCETVALVPGETVFFGVFVGQGVQSAIGVVVEFDLPAVGIDPLAYLAATVVLVERGVAGGVGIAHQLTAGIALILLGAPVRQLAAEQASLGVVAELSALPEGVGDDLQIAALVVAKARGVA